MSLDLEKRKDRIGGSEVRPLYGPDDFGRDQFSVWYSKKGGGERAEPTLWQMLGKLLEPGLLNIYTYLTGRKVEYHDQTVLDPQRPYMAATPDAFCVDERRGVDAKLVLWHQRKHWGETADDIPERVLMQAFWYMSAFDCPCWDIMALIGDEPRVYTIQRLDPEAEAAMHDYVRRWHDKYILHDAIPPMGHSPDAARYLQKLYPDDHRPNMREADQREAELLGKYVQVRIAQNRLKAQREEMETALTAAIKDHEGLTWAEGKFTWRRCRDGAAVQWENMARGLLNEYVKDEAKRAELQEFYTTLKPGYRKIRIDHPALRKGAKDQEQEEAA